MWVALAEAGVLDRIKKKNTAEQSIYLPLLPDCGYSTASYSHDNNVLDPLAGSQTFSLSYFGQVFVSATGKLTNTSFYLQCPSESRHSGPEGDSRRS